MAGRKSKIVRNTMFYSEADYNFEVSIGLDYVSQDMNQTVLVFQIDRTKSMVTNLYGESIGDNSIAYKEPIEINVALLLDAASNKAYDTTQGLGNYLQIGNLAFGVYIKTLKDNKMDISRGDFIGLQVTPDQMEYFEVSNDGRVNFDNGHSLFGYKPFFRTVECVPVDKNKFSGK